MVSRSLEKMMLIAIGLTMAVMVGVPVLLYAVNTINATSGLELARDFAERVHNGTARVDTGEVSDIQVQIVVPRGTSVNAAEHTLSIVYQAQGFDAVTWPDDYIHELDLTAPSTPGTYLLNISMAVSVISIEFTEIT